MTILWPDASRKERLARWDNVLRVLRTLTPHQRRAHWDMSILGEKTECGTVACAAGHCGLDPWFRRRGWKMDFERTDKEEWDDPKVPEYELVNPEFTSLASLAQTYSRTFHIVA